MQLAHIPNSRTELSTAGSVVQADLHLISGSVRILTCSAPIQNQRRIFKLA